MHSNENAANYLCHSDYRNILVLQFKRADVRGFWVEHYICLMFGVLCLIRWLNYYQGSYKE